MWLSVQERVSKVYTSIDPVYDLVRSLTTECTCKYWILSECQSAYIWEICCIWQEQPFHFYTCFLLQLSELWNPQTWIFLITGVKWNTRRAVFNSLEVKVDHSGQCFCLFWRNISQKWGIICGLEKEEWIKCVCLLKLQIKEVVFCVKCVVKTAFSVILMAAYVHSESENILSFRWQMGKPIMCTHAHN